ncbi:DUF1800 domain-containing protein [Parendozoicomonas haliclonae]|uniref:DUF1800 domain-containing protein n=1 Tax=Parendozoicomonas haliclonae TaxID=1960125 RepID=A0A1X7ANQ7_9GAMM|nr:DUF1800 family protein [Parendozoicomonas haliclonae]SMA49934.1 hypothetical protein EHSB41UT_03725 [Parendozoicomonas haliclonae]
MENNKQEAARFLMQATLGADLETINRVAEKGISKWLDEQLDAPLAADDRFAKKTNAIWQSFRKRLVQAYGQDALDGNGNNPALPYQWYFRMAWWDKNLSGKTENLLRHRIAQALSEILVISENSQLELDAVSMASFYDILYVNAFGQYTDILYDVSMHPAMGVYLSHMNNRKADPERNIHPDENYAREIMQLFSIGLFELNRDGSRVKDSQGRDVPTYDNRDIKELARVFTGLKAASYLYEWNTSTFPYNGSTIDFDDGVSKTYKTIPFVDMVKPMVVDPKFHDTGSKTLLKGRINLPSGQSGTRDIRDVVNALVAHPSTGPYIAHKLIQQLVTSNPSPSYVQAVAEAFGDQGDMKAVVKTLLTHPEARQPKKLKSPLLRTTQLLRAFQAKNKSGKLWLTGDDLKESLAHHPMAAPTVFNFYKPDYAPHGPIDNAGLVAPEFELHNSATSIAYVNTMYNWFFGEYYPLVSTKISMTDTNIPELEPDVLFSYKRDQLNLDFSEELVLARRRDFDGLIDRVSLLLNGTAQCEVREDIKTAIANYPRNPKWVVQTVAFLISISPQFAVLDNQQEGAA